MSKPIAASLLLFMAAFVSMPAIADDHTLETADNDAAASYQALREYIWQWRLDNNPGLATSVGDRRGDGQLGDWSVDAHARSIAEARRFLIRLDGINRNALPTELQVDFDVVRQSIEDIVSASAHQHDWYQVFSLQGGWFNQLASLPHGSPFFTSADYESYVGRLNAYAQVN